MRRTEALQGVRMAVFLNLLHRWESAELNQEEAAELLGVSGADVPALDAALMRRKARPGSLDRRLGKASGKRVPSDRAEEVERLYRERYQGFTVKHFHEHLVKDHGFGWGYTWLKLHLQWAGVVPKAPRKGAHRQEARAAAAAGHDAAPGRLAPRLARGRARRLTSLSRSTTRRGRSIRRFWSRRRARPRPSGRSRRSSPSTACR